MTSAVEFVWAVHLIDPKPKSTQLGKNMEFFLGNPFSTPVGQLIGEHAFYMNKTSYKYDTASMNPGCNVKRIRQHCIYIYKSIYFKNKCFYIYAFILICKTWIYIHRLIEGDVKDTIRFRLIPRLSNQMSGAGLSYSSCAPDSLTYMSITHFTQTGRQRRGAANVAYFFAQLVHFYSRFFYFNELISHFISLLRNKINWGF